MRVFVDVIIVHGKNQEHLLLTRLPMSYKAHMVVRSP